MKLEQIIQSDRTSDLHHYVMVTSYSADDMGWEKEKDVVCSKEESGCGDEAGILLLVHNVLTVKQAIGKMSYLEETLEGCVLRRGAASWPTGTWTLQIRKARPITK